MLNYAVMKPVYLCVCVRMCMIFSQVPVTQNLPLHLLKWGKSLMMYSLMFTASKFYSSYNSSKRTDNSQLNSASKSLL